jgi:uncharacterized protein (DUF305 family)
MIKIFIFFILFVLLIVLLNISNKFEPTICNKQLTDTEYINHMIAHHEVAVHMSEIHNTKDPIMLDMLRNLIRLQKYEINLMKDSKIIDNKLNDDMSKNSKMDTSYISTEGDFTNPNTLYLSKTYCDPGFFKMSHTKNVISDDIYIHHMIPHHQVAVDMSKKILKMTRNDFIIDLAYKIIHNQQLEISKLHSLSKIKNRFESTIL